MDKTAASATTAAAFNRISYAPPPSTRPATSTTDPVRPSPAFDAASQRAQERATLDTSRDSTYQPSSQYRQQTFDARFGQVGVTLDVKA
jgi:hypothetical protein